jgi:hypothetical protein
VALLCGALFSPVSPNHLVLIAFPPVACNTTLWEQLFSDEVGRVLVSRAQTPALPSWNFLALAPLSIRYAKRRQLLSSASLFHLQLSVFSVHFFMRFGTNAAAVGLADHLAVLGLGLFRIDTGIVCHLNNSVD